jgi:hypothetical protein
MSDFLSSGHTDRHTDVRHYEVPGAVCKGAICVAYTSGSVDADTTGGYSFKVK